MINEDNIRKHLSDYGLKIEEISKLRIEDAIQYLRFFRWKKWNISSILFLGFPEEETSDLTRRAESCNLTVKNRLDTDLSFICISESANPKRIEKAKSYPATILTKNEFEIIFSGSKYNLENSELLYDRLVSKEFRITKPLSNFDQYASIESFSINSENTYSANLYRMTCTCKDFEKKKRKQYLKGDIRRLCMHLMSIYKNSFGLHGMSDLNSFIIEKGYPMNKHFRYFNIEKIRLPIVVNFESKDDWWNIIMANEKGVYTKYSYLPIEKRFSYDSKPIGSVPALRNKLNELRNEFTNDM